MGHYEPSLAIVRVDLHCEHLLVDGLSQLVLDLKSTFLIIIEESEIFYIIQGSDCIREIMKIHIHVSGIVQDSPYHIQSRVGEVNIKLDTIVCELKDKDVAGS